MAAWREQNAAGALPATFEIVYGHAWKLESDKSPRVLADGRAVINFVKK
jgi:malonyl-CoA O-methyltransferase